MMARDAQAGFIPRCFPGFRPSRLREHAAARRRHPRCGRRARAPGPTTAAPADLASPAAPTLPGAAAMPAAEATSSENASVAPTAPAASATNDCKLATKGDSPVAKACQAGGVKAAKAAMKDLVKRAKDNGAKFRCDDCHKDPQDMTKLAADARDRFKTLLAAAK
jgi:hypothetical protein